MWLTGCTPRSVGSDWHYLSPRVAAPPFSLPVLGGGEATLSGYRGKIVIMEFWATWCGPCRFSLPSLEVIYKRYKDQGVVVLLVNEGETEPVVRQWVENRFTAPILLDEKQMVGRLYGVGGIPRLFIVDQEGALVYEHAGYGGGLERNLSLILDGFLSGAAAEKA